MTRALEKERRKHELAKKALELSCRTTQQMHAVWDDIMTNPLVIPNYMHANEADVPAHEEKDELLHQELHREAEQSQGALDQPTEEEAEAEEEEEDHEELELQDHHDPHDPSNPPHDPPNPPNSTNLSTNNQTDNNCTNNDTNPTSSENQTNPTNTHVQ